MLRDAVADDYPSMCHVHRAAILSIGNEFYSEAQKQSWAMDLSLTGYSKGAEEGEFFRVACDDDKICGFSSTKSETLYALYVNPRDHGKGVGTMLLKDYETRAGVSLGKVRASLNAESFYAAHSWQKKSTDSFTSRGGLVLQVSVMEKLL